MHEKQSLCMTGLHLSVQYVGSTLRAGKHKPELAFNSLQGDWSWANDEGPGTSEGATAHVDLDSESPQQQRVATAPKQSTSSFDQEPSTHRPEEQEPTPQQEPLLPAPSSDRQSHWQQVEPSTPPPAVVHQQQRPPEVKDDQVQQQQQLQGSQHPQPQQTTLRHDAPSWEDHRPAFLIDGEQGWMLIAVAVAPCRCMIASKSHGSVS